MSALIKNSFWGGLATVMNMIAGIVAILIGIRLIGSENFGYLTLLLSFTMLFLAVNKGMTTVLVSRLQESHQQENGQAPELIGAGLLYTLLSALMLMTFVYYEGDVVVRALVYFGDDIFLENQIITVLYLLTAATLLELFSMLSASAIEGLGRFDLAAQYNMVYPVSLLTGMCWLMWSEGAPLLTMLASVYFLASLIRFFVAQYVWLKWIGFDGLRPGDIVLGWGRLNDLSRRGVKIQGAGVLTLFVDPLNKMLLNLFVGPAGVTHYDLAVRAATSVQNVFSQGFRSFMALPVHEEGGNSIRLYLKLLAPSLRIAILMYIIAGISFVLIKGMGIVEISSQVIYLFWVIVPSGLAIIAILPLYHILVRRGDLNYIFKLTALLAVCNVIFSILLIPMLGLIGAGVGIIVATLINCASVFHRYSTCVQPIKNIHNIIGQRYFLFGGGLLLIVIVPAIILRLFEWMPVVGLSSAVVMILLASGRMWFELRSIWSQKDEFA